MSIYVKELDGQKVFEEIVELNKALIPYRLLPMPTGRACITIRQEREGYEKTDDGGIPKK